MSSDKKSTNISADSQGSLGSEEGGMESEDSTSSSVFLGVHETVLQTIKEDEFCSDTEQEIQKSTDYYARDGGRINKIQKLLEGQRVKEKAEVMVDSAAVDQVNANAVEEKPPTEVKVDPIDTTGKPTVEVKSDTNAFKKIDDLSAREDVMATKEVVNQLKRLEKDLASKYKGLENIIIHTIKANYEEKLLVEKRNFQKDLEIKDSIYLNELQRREVTADQQSVHIDSLEKRIRNLESTVKNLKCENADSSMKFEAKCKQQIKEKEFKISKWENEKRDILEKLESKDNIIDDLRNKLEKKK